MKKKVMGLVLIASMLVLTGCNTVPKLSNGQDLVAKIDGKEITAEEVYDKLKKQYGTAALINTIDDFIANKEVATDEDATESAKSQLESIKFNFQSQGQDFEEALRSSGYLSEAEFLEDLILEYKKTKIVENYYENLLTEEEIEKYYNEDVYGEMDVRHILIIPEEKTDEKEQEAAKKEALNKANDLIKQLDAGKKFEDLVKEHSDDTGSKDNGGLIKDVNKDEHVKEFYEASTKLEKGKYTKTPVETQFGYHIILKVEQKAKPELKDAKDNIIDKLVQNKINESQDAGQIAWVEVRKKYNLDIFDKEIKGIYELNVKALDTK
ncbi:MAG: peptidylprolyl isomerase [Bacilli bacterium]|nr:peptidylprolyl isomerase [Bacilli bacterium]MDD4547616.1 peptidylprolyl isomerase [Bacilli bacterium]